MTEQEIDQLINTIQLMPNTSTLEKYAAIQWIRQCPPWLSVVIDEVDSLPPMGEIAVSC